MATDMIMWAVGEELGAILKEEASYMQQVCDSHMRSYALLPRPRRKISEPAWFFKLTACARNLQAASAYAYGPPWLLQRCRKLLSRGCCLTLRSVSPNLIQELSLTMWKSVGVSLRSHLARLKKIEYVSAA